MGRPGGWVEEEGCLKFSQSEGNLMPVGHCGPLPIQGQQCGFESFTCSPIALSARLKETLLTKAYRIRFCPPRSSIFAT